MHYKLARGRSCSLSVDKAMHYKLARGRSCSLSVDKAIPAQLVGWPVGRAASCPQLQFRRGTNCCNPGFSNGKTGAIVDMYIDNIAQRYIIYIT